jgi:hypothetical protein
MAIVSFDAAVADGAAIAADKRTAHNARDRWNDAFIDNYAVYHLGRFQDETQDDGTKSTRFPRSAADCQQSAGSPSYFDRWFCVTSFLHEKQLPGDF